MTGILDRIRTTTVADLEKVSGSFDDVPTPAYRPRVAREMQRIATGATDLSDAYAGRPAPKNPGMVKIQDWSGHVDEDYPSKAQVDDYIAHRSVTDARSEAQIAYMDNLITWITEKDAVAGTAARTWTDKVTAAGKWEIGRDNPSKFSISGWINRLKAKNADLKAAPVAVQAKTNAWARWRELASKLAVVGGSRGTRFAVETEPGAVNTIAFWRITPSQDKTKFYLNQIIGGQGAVKVRMSPEAMVAIAEKIIEAGPVEAMVRYGLELGECGHCGRELTNDASRTAGIGPKCRKHMGGWN